MSIFQLKSTIRVVCARFCAPYLEQELLVLGYNPVTKNESGIEIKGSILDCMKLNLRLRSAYRVLFLIDSFEAENADALYEKINILPWDEYIPANGYVSITSHVDNPSINDTRFANLRVKDAVVDQINSKLGIRPNSGSDTSHTVLFLFWKNNEASIYIDTSGDTIAKHNYRRISAQAPMMEALAASVIMATGWRGEGYLINPMCGSGTLAIEAALIAINKAPGLMRSNFGFMHLADYKESQWQELREQATSEIDDQKDFKIIATDRDFRAISASQTNARAAGVERYIEFKTLPFERTFLPKEGGIIIINPPYGERIGNIEELESLYTHIGFWFKENAVGYNAYVFTGSPELAKRLGLKTSRRIPFYNATLECRLLEFELYKGTRRNENKNKEPEDSGS